MRHIDGAAFFAQNLSEDNLQTNVLAEARKFGWTAYHTHDSRHSAAGFPDLFMVRASEIVVMELKSETGVVSDDQQWWLDALATVPGVRWAGVIRPSNWYAGDVERILT